MNTGFYKAACQAKIKIGFNDLPCLKYHDLIGAKIQLKSLNTKAVRKCLVEISKCNEIKLKNGISIAGKIFPALKFG